jgi:hypothetical protein
MHFVVLQINANSLLAATMATGKHHCKIAVERFLDCVPNEFSDFLIIHGLPFLSKRICPIVVLGLGDFIALAQFVSELVPSFTPCNLIKPAVDTDEILAMIQFLEFSQCLLFGHDCPLFRFADLEYAIQAI